MPLLARSAGGQGFKDATTDLERIAEWWTRWPSANIGMPTGQASGIYVIDFDGDSARQTWRRLFPGEPLPPTTWARTGRPDGLHLWFQIPDDAGQLPNTTLGPKLETRGDGGYVLVAPSMHPSGRRFTLNIPTPPLSMPSWLLHAVMPRPAAPAPQGQRRVELGSGEITLEGQRRMLGLIRRLEETPEGGRHRTLYWAARLAGEMADRGLVEAGVARAALLATAIANGLVDDEGEMSVERTIADGMAKGGGL